MNAYGKAPLPLLTPLDSIQVVLRTSGAILDDFGFRPVLEEVMKQYVQPLVPRLYTYLDGYPLDHHHGFAVEYEIGKDRKLDFHVNFEISSVDLTHRSMIVK